MESAEENPVSDTSTPTMFNRNYIIGTTNTPYGNLNIFAQISYSNELNWYIRGIIYPPSDNKSIDIHPIGPIWMLIKTLEKEDCIFNSMEDAESSLIKLASIYGWEYTYNCNCMILYK